MASSSTLLGCIQRDEIPWSFYGRLRWRYPKTSHERLADFVGTVPSYRKGFPTQLRCLANALDYEGAPDLERILVDHTFFPFALPEISSADADRLFSSMADETFPLAVPGSLKHSADFRVRICEDCLKEDMRRLGFSYYHRMHQPPAMRHCSRPGHHSSLIETVVTSATRDYIDPASAIDQGRRLDPGHIQHSLNVAEAYAELARVGRNSCSGDQARQALIELLTEHGHWDGTKITPGFARSVGAKNGQEMFKQFGLTDLNRLETWVAVPGLAVACAHYGVEFKKFLLDAARFERQAPPPPPPSSKLQLELFDTVKKAAPKIIAELNASESRVSIWAIATRIDRLTGHNFASNWSWRSPFRELLREQIHAAGC